MLTSRSIVLTCFSLAILYYVHNHMGQRLFQDPKSPYAFATFLGNFTTSGIPSRHSHTGIPHEDPDGYYLGARYLNYMIRHHPDTRSRTKIPVLILATEDVEEYKLQKLRQEGAQVIRTEKITPPYWLKPGDMRYADVLTKLRLWQLNTFEKICFLDADVLLTAPIDGVFNDPATEKRPIGELDLGKQKNPEGDRELPENYVFAAHGENYHLDHPIPPNGTISYLNSGFFVLAPNELQYQYYLSKIQDSTAQDWKGGTFPEQDLFNDIHHWAGAMPWQQLDWRWNMNYPTYKDFQAGVRSFHDKYWEDEQSDPDFRSDKTLKAIWLNQVRGMESFYWKEGI